MRNGAAWDGPDPVRSAFPDQGGRGGPGECGCLLSWCELVGRFEEVDGHLLAAVPDVEHALRERLD